VQILHPFTGSAQQYAEEVATPDRYRPRPLPAVSGAPAADRARFLQPHAGGGGL